VRGALPPEKKDEYRDAHFTALIWKNNAFEAAYMVQRTGKKRVNPLVPSAQILRKKRADAIAHGGLLT
jgi:hypothetical protein